MARARASSPPRPSSTAPTSGYDNDSASREAWSSATATTTTTAAASWVGQPRVKGSSEFTRMALLTCSMIGLQFCWGTEMTYATPYLLALGLSKSKLSLVWVAGPLSGLVMQPVIGMVSDKSYSKYGRRRPFMVAGSLAVAVCLVLLGWANEVAAWFVSDAETRREFTIALAVVDIYVLDFVINIAQSTCRALIVDTLPVSKQQLGSAWAGRMVGVGQMLVYGIGALDLDGILGNFLGNTQFKKVCLIAALAMLLAQGITCYAVDERVLVSEGGKADHKKQGILSILGQIYRTTLNVPARIQYVCWVQFWSWIGWFPFLFYGTTWVGEIFLRHGGGNQSRDALTDVGRVGSTAMIVFSIVSFGSSIVLPWLVRNPEEEEKPGYRTRTQRNVQSMLSRLTQGKPSLLTAWMTANLLFAASMIFAPLVRSVGLATFIMAFCGIPWAVDAWASGTFIGIEVNKLESSLPTSYGRTASHSRYSTDSFEFDNAGESMSLHVRHGSSASLTSSSTGELSGIYLGILNIYTTLPQFVGTGISWVVFSILEPGKSLDFADDKQQADSPPTEGLSGIGVCLFIGAICAVGAAYATRRLRT